MIVVVADDFSGAAEVAGWAVADGRTAEVQRAFEARSTAEVVVLDTDSRTLSPTDAARRLSQVAEDLRRARVERVFKKVDSVLRGPVAAELEALRRGLRRRRTLLVPANPRRSRVVRQGRYFIGDTPLDQTLFAADPEYPARSADVRELLHPARGVPVHVAATADHRLPDEGLVVGDAESPADLAGWVERLDKDTLPAGAAEWFVEWLVRQPRGDGSESPRRAEEWPAFSPALFAGGALMVCGSPAAWRQGRGAECRARGIPILEIGLSAASDDAAEHVGRLRSAGRWLADEGRLLVTCGSAAVPAGASAQYLVDALASFAAQVVRDAGVDRVLVEGGATASALVRRLGWGRFRAGAMLGPGITPLAPLPDERPLLISKPGSYAWPDAIW